MPNDVCIWFAPCHPSRPPLLGLGQHTAAALCEYLCTASFGDALLAQAAALLVSPAAPPGMRAAAVSALVDHGGARLLPRPEACLAATCCPTPAGESDEHAWRGCLDAGGGSVLAGHALLPCLAAEVVAGLVEDAREGGSEVLRGQQAAEEMAAALEGEGAAEGWLGRACAEGLVAHAAAAVAVGMGLEADALRPLSRALWRGGAGTQGELRRAGEALRGIEAAVALAEALRQSLGVAKGTQGDLADAVRGLCRALGGGDAVA